jgi:curved DNA-binding protein CbpA
MDPFQTLGLPRRPLLTELEIGSAYRRQAGKLHPDQAEGDEARFKELGEAAAILQDPSRRLRALNGEVTGNTLPPKAADLFPKVAAILQQSDRLLEKQTAATNALAKALLAAPTKSVYSEVESMLQQLQDWYFLLDQELSLIDASWPMCDQFQMNMLADSFAYAGRWQSQIRDRKLALGSILE